VQVYGKMAALLSHLNAAEGYDDDLGVHVGAASRSSTVNCNKHDPFLYKDKEH
jgi:hypothetical protein